VLQVPDNLTHNSIMSPGWDCAGRALEVIELERWLGIRGDSESAARAVVVVDGQAGARGTAVPDFADCRGRAVSGGRGRRGAVVVVDRPAVGMDLGRHQTSKCQCLGIRQ
jgi:hypothetical protein